MTIANSSSPRFLTLADLTPQPGCTLVIGNFDGVHRGHQALLAQARARGRPVVVLSFEPHPRQYFAARQGAVVAPLRLTPPALKTRLLRAAGADSVVLLAFEAALAEVDATAFIDKVIVQGLGASHIVVGEDFVFGRDRGGSIETLRADGRFSVTAVTPVGDAAGVFSSSRARQLLAAGDLVGLANILGRAHSIAGPVLHGDKRGRTLGYPTANQSLAGLALPPLGIYAVRVRLPHESVPRIGAANLGIRPMFAVEYPILETFIFDFDQDIYDQDITVELVKFLRPEARFDSLDALMAQMKQDCQAARAVFQSVSL